jgi:hypothetical protein
VKHATFAVGWLLKQLPLVPEACFGRICPDSSKTTVFHRLFKEHESPRAFANPEELAEYISRVRITHVIGLMISILSHVSCIGISAVPSSQAPSLP